jgi:hypothetical protein
MTIRKRFCLIRVSHLRRNFGCWREGENIPTKNATLAIFFHNILGNKKIYNHHRMHFWKSLIGAKLCLKCPFYGTNSYPKEKNDQWREMMFFQTKTWQRVQWQIIHYSQNTI